MFFFFFLSDRDIFFLQDETIGFILYILIKCNRICVIRSNETIWRLPKVSKLWAPLELSCNQNRRDRVWSSSAQRFGCVRIMPQDCDWNGVVPQDHMTPTVSVVFCVSWLFVCFYEHLSVLVLEFRNSWPRFSVLLHLLTCSHRRGDVRLAKNTTACDSWVWSDVWRVLHI